MNIQDAAYLLAEIRKAMDGKFRLNEVEKSIIHNIVERMKRRQPISERQAFAIQEIYRKSQGHYDKLYSRVI